MPPNALHITLAVTRLETEDDERIALNVLSRLAPRLHTLVPPDEPLQIAGVRSFRDKVLYAAVAHHEGLYKFVAELRAALLQAGLPNGEHEEYTAHMTLFKLPRAFIKSMGSIPRSVWFGVSGVSFGDLHVGGASLNWMGGAGSSGGSSYYKSIGECRLGRMLFDSQPILPTVKAGEEPADVEAKELHVFDFDLTLARTLGPKEGRACYRRLTGERWPHSSWLDRPESLRAPLPVRAGPALAALKASIRRQSEEGGSRLRTVIITGRPGSVRGEILAFLTAHGVALPSSHVLTRPSETPRGPCKGAALRHLLTSRFKRVGKVIVWDDDPTSLQEYEALREELLAEEYEKLSGHGRLAEGGFKLIDAAALPPPPPPAPGSSACRGFLRERLTPTHRVPPGEAEITLILDCWQFAISEFGVRPSAPSNGSGSERPLHPFAPLLLPFGSHPLGRPSSDFDCCLLAPASTTLALARRFL